MRRVGRGLATLREGGDGFGLWVGDQTLGVRRHTDACCEAEEEVRWSPVMAVQLGAGVGTQIGRGLKGPAMVEGQMLFQLAFANSDGGLGRFHG